MDNDTAKIEHNHNDDVANIRKWLIVYRLTLNIPRTESMVIVSRQRLNTFDSPPVLVFDGARVGQVKPTKSLGLNIDDRLSWFAA